MELKNKTKFYYNKINKFINTAIFFTKIPANFIKFMFFKENTRFDSAFIYIKSFEIFSATFRLKSREIS